MDIQRCLNISVNFNSYTAKINGEEIDVNAKELEVLKCLLDNNGQVLTRMQIIDYVWKDSEEGRRGQGYTVD